MKELKDIQVLVTGAGAKYTPGLFHCLRDNGERKVSIIGVDPSAGDAPTVQQMVDTALSVPYVSAPQYVNELLAWCRIFHPEVIIPTISTELPLLIERKREFEAIGVKVSVSTMESVNTCLSKLRLYGFMTQYGIPTPKYHAIHSLKDFDEALEYIGYPKQPVCIKATQLSGSRGVRVIDPSKSRFDVLFGEKPNSLYTTQYELRAILQERESEIPEMMAMEYLPGEEYSVDILADHGKVLYICGRQSNTILASIPQSATLYEDTRAYKIVEQVVEALGIDGNADFDFRYNAKGEPVLMECNPRVAATMAIFKEGGLNLPYLRVKQLLGEPLPEISIKYEVKMVRRYQEYYC